MAHVEPGDAHDEMRDWLRRACCCKHWDRRECYLLRYPLCGEHPEEQRCDCACHDDAEEGER